MIDETALTDHGSLSPLEAVRRFKRFLKFGGAMKITRSIIRIDEEKCNGCGLCVPSCAEGAIRIINGKARLVAEKYCDGLGACLGECPQNALSIIETEAEAFDMGAVHQHTRSPEPLILPLVPDMPCGCPSTLIETFPSTDTCETANQPSIQATLDSALSHWPIQIQLVPTSAPFLKYADLLIAADCTPVAYAGFHRDFLAGRTILMGCPKFDDIQSYVDKFTQIFQKNPIRSITVLVMEVPCCQGLPKIVRQAVTQAGLEIPMDTVTVSRQGKILKP